jgi:hypothetical protein
MFAALFLSGDFESFPLQGHDFLRLRALLTFRDDELHTLAFVQGAESFHHDGAVVHENVFAGIALDKAVALRTIEPFHGALFFLGHDLELSFRKFCAFVLQRSKSKDGVFLFRTSVNKQRIIAFILCQCQLQK